MTEVKRHHNSHLEEDVLVAPCKEKRSCFGIIDMGLFNIYELERRSLGQSTDQNLTYRHGVRICGHRHLWPLRTGRPVIRQVRRQQLQFFEGQSWEPSTRDMGKILKERRKTSEIYEKSGLRVVMRLGRVPRLARAWMEIFF